MRVCLWFLGSVRPSSKIVRFPSSTDHTVPVPGRVSLLCLALQFFFLLPVVRYYGRVLSLLLLFSQFGYRYLGDGGTDRREILHDSTYRPRTDLLQFWGLYRRNFGLNLGHLTANK